MGNERISTDALTSKLIEYQPTASVLQKEILHPAGRGHFDVIRNQISRQSFISWKDAYIDYLLISPIKYRMQAAVLDRVLTSPLASSTSGVVSYGCI
jgi:hypothetical protein